MSSWKGIIGKSFTAPEFAAYVSGLSFTVWRPSFIVLHNTAIPTFAQWHKTPGATRMKNLETYYRDTQKWSAGPHLFIADDFIWVFTPLTVPGVHAPSWNNLSWGVELVGDYTTEQIPTQLKSNAISALATLHGALGIIPSTLRLHLEDPKTTHKTCPGKNISKSDFITEITAQLTNPPPGGSPATGTSV